ncbi:aldo/keto reductase [Mesoplasma seiffertii]|uniref:aldo/keto reductase n=1 Tax=Mesoplasma seiffertii TaxID=28224 RepID=UPI000479A02E|nr:aldo/keto reductase [Mesoplasma seiffertii]
MKYIKLNDGNKIPLIGFGTFQMTDSVQCEKVVLEALAAGYRLIDTAQSYFNEEAVGNAITKSQVPREELFITTKVWVDNYGYEKTIASVKESLKKLQLDYLDLVLLHQPFANYYEAYRALVFLQKQGLIKSIGVSNFYPDRIADLCLFNEEQIMPAVNQIEINPFFQQQTAISVNHKYGVIAQAWAPFAEGRNNIFDNSVLKSIADKHQKSVAQIILRWLYHQDIPFCVKSSKKERIRENLNILDFELVAEDMLAITSLNLDKSSFFDHSSVEGPELIKKLVVQRAAK